MKAWTWMKVVVAMAPAWLGLAAVATADVVGNSWRRVDAGDGEQMAAVSWNGPLMVGVGSGGQISTSTDGKSWVKHFHGIQADLKSVVWSGTHYVAVGSSGAMLRSTNGLDWQRVEMPVEYDYKGVTWTGSQFIALDSGFYLSTSADGLVWSRFAVTPVQALSYGIEYYDGATYLRNTFGIARSTDLTTWTQVLALSNNHLPAAVRKCNGRLISVGPSNEIYSSLDGITWTPATLTGVTFPPQDMVDVEWNGSSYVAIGASNRVWRSLDGQSWTTEHSVVDGAKYVKWLNGEFVAGDGVRTVQTSSDGREWTKTRGRTIGTATVWAGSRYIAVGYYGYVATSADFETWSTRDINLYPNLTNVVWTGSFALAAGGAGADGVVLKSTDGVTWTRVGQATFTGTVRLVWTGSQVYAFSSSGVHVSTNGTSWTPITATVASHLDRVKWLRGMFLNVGSTGMIHTSPDGITWTQRVSGTTSALYALGASANEFLVGGNGGVLLGSPDGVTWTPRSFAAVTVSAVEYRFGKWFIATSKGMYESVDGIAWSVVPGVKESTSINANAAELVWTGSELACSGLEAKTADGVSWTQLPMAISAPDFGAVAKGPGGYVAVGSGGAIWQSPDGYAWHAVVSPTTNTLSVVKQGRGLWVAAGASGTIVTSPDGVTWTLRTSGTSNNLLDLACNGLRFAVVGANGTLLTSEDGVSWSVKATGTTTVTIGNVVAMGTTFRALLSGSSYLESPDGVTWTLVTPQPYTDVAFNGSYYVALSSGTGGAYANVSSADGLTWTRYSMGSTTFFTGICWTGSLWVACGQSGAILTSPDGITWTPRTSGATTWIQAVNSNGPRVVAVGHGSTVLYSPDGITWTKGTPPGGFSRDFEDVAWADGRYVAAGGNDASATSTDGITWQSISGTPGSNLTVEKIGTRFVAAGVNFFSTTGTAAWAFAGSPSVLGSIYDMDTNASLLTFAATSDGVHRIQPGTAANSWKSSRVYDCPWLDNIVANGNEFVAVGQYGTIVLSRNGSAWQTVQGGRDVLYNGVAWNGSRLAAAGASQMQWSLDGVTWQASATPFAAGASYALTDVVWTGSRFLAMGVGSTLLQCGADGASWTSIGNSAVNPGGVTGIAGDDQLLVAVGSDGQIVVSDGLSAAAGDYQAWIAGEGAGSGSAAPAQDANGDGIDNLMAYVFGIPAVDVATTVDRGALPVVSMDGEAGPVLSFELRESYRPGMTYAVEVSPDLEAGSWMTLQQYSAGWATGAGRAVVSESPLAGGGVRVTVSGFPGVGLGGSWFFRVRAVLP
ncbi:hypothetical protein WKV53_13605 [Luteolibacter sp. Y139]|uniref:DUF6242 domain-containing protein n=2 Tax=Luteolibacter soli TaxID=3135280 RepID=A0ABU9AV36_9BACT